ncbi:MAG TPA: hypothetical protein VF942_11220 [Acidimicrobiales bacterium]
MIPLLAAVVLTNLLYVVGAIVVATLISALIVLRHRRPKSLEAGIESFNRELRALAPEQAAGPDRGAADGQSSGLRVPVRPMAPGRMRPTLSRSPSLNPHGSAKDRDSAGTEGHAG